MSGEAYCENRMYYLLAGLHIQLSLTSIQALQYIYHSNDEMAYVSDPDRNAWQQRAGRYASAF